MFAKRLYHRSLTDLHLDDADFWNLKWFRPRLKVRDRRACERISEEEYEWQATEWTRDEVDRLRSSDPYKLFAQVKGNDPA